MEFSHVFYKEVLVDKSNIFSLDLAQNNDIKHTLSVACQLIKTFNLMFLCQMLKEKKPSATY